MSSVRLRADRIANARVNEELAVVRLPAVTMTQLAFYCAAAGVVDPIHYDRDFARHAGFPDSVVNGSLRVAWMAQVASELVAPEGRLVYLKCVHRRLMLIGQIPEYTVRLAKLEAGPAEGLPVEVDISCRVDGEVCDVGTARLFLSR